MTLSTPTRQRRTSGPRVIAPRRPRVITLAFWLSVLAVVAGAGYRLGAAFKYGDAYDHAPYAKLAWLAVVNGTAGLVIVALTWIVWRLSRAR